MLRSQIYFGRLNLPIKAKFHKKSCGRIPCSCWAKIEAWQIHKLWRSLELRICNFLKNYLTTSTICMSERTAFVVFLEKSKVRIPLLFINWWCMTKRGSFPSVTNHRPNVRVTQGRKPIFLSKKKKKNSNPSVTLSHKRYALFSKLIIKCDDHQRRIENAPI